MEVIEVTLQFGKRACCKNVRMYVYYYLLYSNIFIYYILYKLFYTILYTSCLKFLPLYNSINNTYIRTFLCIGGFR